MTGHRPLVVGGAAAGVLLILGGAATLVLLLRERNAGQGATKEECPGPAPAPDPTSGIRKKALEEALAAAEPLTRGQKLLALWRAYPDTAEGSEALRNAIDSWTKLCRGARAPSKLADHQSHELSVIRREALQLRDELVKRHHPLDVEAQRLVLEAAERRGDAAGADQEMRRYVKLLLERKGLDGAARQLLDESVLLCDLSLLIDRPECKRWWWRRVERIREDLPGAAAAPEAEIWRLWLDASTPGNFDRLVDALAAAPKSRVARRAYSTVLNHLTLKKDYDQALKLLDLMEKSVPEKKQAVDFQRARVYFRQGKTDLGAATLEPYTRRPHPRRLRNYAKSLIEQATKPKGQPPAVSAERSKP